MYTKSQKLCVCVDCIQDMKKSINIHFGLENRFSLERKCTHVVNWERKGSSCSRTTHSKSFKRLTNQRNVKFCPNTVYKTTFDIKVFILVLTICVCKLSYTTWTVRCIKSNFICLIWQVFGEKVFRYELSLLDEEQLFLLRCKTFEEKTFFNFWSCSFHAAQFAFPNHFQLILAALVSLKFRESGSIKGNLLLSESKQIIIFLNLQLELW